MTTTQQSSSLSQVDKAKEIVAQVVEKLKGKTNEATIRAIVIQSWEQAEEVISAGSMGKYRTQLRKAIESAFPSSLEPKAGYYFSNEGKNKEERYQHIALWYATTNKDRWEVVGDAARAEYFKNLKPFDEPQPELKEMVVEAPVLETPVVEAPILDTEVQQIVQDAITQKDILEAIAESGMTLTEFIQQAIANQAKAIMANKNRQSELTLVDTATLRTSPKYKTHPNRAEELFKRAIQAIKDSNGKATELNKKWLITQSLLSEMTGAKPATVGELMKKYQSDIDSYNQVLKEAGANSLLNRKGELKKDFCDEWVNIIPNGI